MTDLHNELDNKFTTEQEYQTSEYKRGHDRMQMLEDMLAQEREDRIKSLND